MLKKKKPKSPKSLAGKKSKGQVECNAAKTFFSKKANKNKTFDFNAYKENDVRELLEKVFNKKCAYCESTYKATSPTDIEHYRPKAQVENQDTNKKSKPGYFWLAADWSNLLPSCIGCNRRMNQKVVGQKKKIVVGKGDLFPLEDEKDRAKKPGDEKKEKPLLLNPCVDDPMEHLVFDKMGMIYPKKKKNGVSERGKKSIEVYGLQREDLVDLRLNMCKIITQRVDTIQMLEQWSKDYPKNKSFQKKLNTEISQLKELLDENQPYLGMIRQLLHELLGL